MKQKYKFLNMFKNGKTIDVKTAKGKGIKNPRQQVYFLRKDGHRIINCDCGKYRMLP